MTEKIVQSEIEVRVTRSVIKGGYRTRGLGLAAHGFSPDVADENLRRTLWSFCRALERGGGKRVDSIVVSPALTTGQQPESGGVGIMSEHKNMGGVCMTCGDRWPCFSIEDEAHEQAIADLEAKLQESQAACEIAERGLLALEARITEMRSALAAEQAAHAETRSHLQPLADRWEAAEQARDDAVNLVEILHGHVHAQAEQIARLTEALNLAMKWANCNGASGEVALHDEIEEFDADMQRVSDLIVTQPAEPHPNSREAVRRQIADHLDAVADDRRRRYKRARHREMVTAFAEAAMIVREMILEPAEPPRRASVSSPVPGRSPRS